MDAEVWTHEANLIAAFYDRFGDRLPQALREEHAALVDRLAAARRADFNREERRA